MSTATTKQVTIEAKTSGTTVELGGLQVELTLQNDLASFAKPNRAGGNPETRALNLNQIEKAYTVRGEIDDRFVEATDGTLTTKEGLRDQLITIMESAEHLTFTYGSKTDDGYLTKLKFKERAAEENSVYDIQFTFLVCVPMNS